MKCRTATSRYQLLPGVNMDTDSLSWDFESSDEDFGLTGTQLLDLDDMDDMDYKPEESDDELDKEYEFMSDPEDEDDPEFDKWYTELEKHIDSLPIDYDKHDENMKIIEGIELNDGKFYLDGYVKSAFAFFVGERVSFDSLIKYIEYQHEEELSDYGKERVRMMIDTLKVEYISEKMKKVLVLMNSFSEQGCRRS